MKKLFKLVVVSIALFVNTPLHAQSFEYGTSAMQPRVHRATSTRHHTHQKFPAVTQVGTVMSVVGIGVGVWGLGSAISGFNLVGKGNNGQAFDSQGNTGVTMFLVGGVVGLAGMGMALAGISQMHHHQRYGWQLVTPKNNQVGIAYNF